MKKAVQIDGNLIMSADDFYKALEAQVKIPAYFGRNLDALWDIIMAGEIADKDNPIEIEWINAGKTRQQLGDFFEKLVSLFRDANKEGAAVTLVVR